MVISDLETDQNHTVVEWAACYRAPSIAIYAKQYKEHHFLYIY